MNQISKIMARFLPLMDLSILLLGCFMVVLTAAKFDDVTNGKERETASIIARSVAEHTCVMLYVVACKGEVDEYGRPNGEIYALDKDDHTSPKPISKTSSDDIEAIIKEILPRNRKPEEVVVFILSQQGAGDDHVPRDLCLKLKESWKLPRIYRVTGVDIDPTPLEVK